MTLMILTLRVRVLRTRKGQVVHQVLDEHLSHINIDHGVFWPRSFPSDLERY